MKLPSNWEARQRKAEWLLNDDKLREEAKEKVYKPQFNILYKF